MSPPKQAASIDDLLASAGWVRGLARALTANRADGDDLAQDAWVAALRNPPPERPGRAWMTVVLRHLFVNTRVSERRRRAREEAADSPSSSPAPEDLAQRLEAQRRLAALVADLPDPYREVVLLRYYEGLSAAEIARALGLPSGTVRWRLSEAIGRLRAKLDEGPGGRRAWMAALVPFSKTKRKPTSLRMWWAVSLLASLGIGGLVVSRTRAPWTYAIEQGAESEHTVVSRRPDVARASAMPSSQRSCGIEIADLRARLRAVEVDIGRKAMPTPGLWRMAQPNPAATAALTPVLDRALARASRATPPSSVECRGWFCRVTVLFPMSVGLLGAQDLMREATAQGLGDRATWRRSGGVTPTTALGGETSYRAESWLKLAVISGANKPRVGADEPPPQPAAGPRPPADLLGCQSEATSLRAQVASVARELAAALPNQERFDHASPNPALAVDVLTEVHRILGVGPSATYEVECRGQLCLLSGPRPTDPWRRILDRDERLRARMYGGGVASGGFFIGFKTDATMAYERALLARLDEAKAQISASCAAHLIAGAKLWAAISIPSPGTENDGGEKDRPSWRFTGVSAGSSLAACAASPIQVAIDDRPLPPDVGPGSLSYRLHADD